jgi:hypothetical protein
MTSAVGEGHDLESRLLRLLTMVNDWLKYAEAKNSLVVGLSSAGLFGSLTAVPDTIEGSSHHDAALSMLLAGVIALIISLSLSLMSFMPRTNLTKWLARRQGSPTKDDNLYYYGHLAKYIPRNLAQALERRYEPRTGRGSRDDPDDLSDGEVEIAEQIVINARITLWKLGLFTPALVCFAVGVLLQTAAMVTGTIWDAPQLAA